jgi:N-acetylmuramoyl-L-alanine amidase-like protein
MARSPILEPPSWVERRACRIADPVERLRFLRRQMRGRRQARLTGIPAMRVARSRSWHVASMVACLVVMVGIVPLPIGTAETFAKERRLVVETSQQPPVVNGAQRVWLVDRSGSLELYSNGLRIDVTFAVANRPRNRFPIFSVNGGAEPLGEKNTPVGIVYHTTESNLAPFEEDENRRLQRIGHNLIEWIREDRSYHYVIDRFGRVYRVVQEGDAANHAGSSIWADSRGVYVNLNDSFIGVSFEGQTGAVDEVTQAQVSAGKVLTEMLRSRYGIATEDCVTHAQVSVNPQNMRIGAHTDWAGKFPFAGVGLPDNYSLPLPSLSVFGFEYDSVFLKMTGTRWHGLDVAELQVARQAAAEGLETGRYRAMLQHRYKDIASALKEKSEEVVK